MPTPDFAAEAFSQAKRFVELYQDAETVVIPSSSCVAMIRDQYPGLFEELGNEELAQAVRRTAARVYELSEFLIDNLGVEDVGAYFPHRVTYHASCHGLRALHVGDRPFRLLNKVRGLELVPLANLERCCGFGGTFSIKNAEVSSAMLATKLAGRAVDRRRVLHRPRQQLPDAPGRGAASAEGRHADDSPGARFWPAPKTHPHWRRMA